jgi:hypothetical protein
MVKVVTIDATFPELKSGAMYQTGRGRGSSVRVAGARAFANLLRQPKLRGKKGITMFKATVSIGTEAEVVESTPEAQQ